MGARTVPEIPSQGQFVPFSVGKDTVVFPGYDGGSEWGGPAVDRETKILYVNSNDVVDTGSLEKVRARSRHGRARLHEPMRPLPSR